MLKIGRVIIVSFIFLVCCVRQGNNHVFDFSLNFSFLFKVHTVVLLKVSDFLSFFLFSDNRYQNAEFVEMCTKEYLAERSEYRRTGIKQKMKKKDAVIG